MSDRLPFFLHEAVIALYPADLNGAPTGAAIWSGAHATGLRFSRALQELVVQGSGELYGIAHHIDEENVISIERTWILRKPALADLLPQRNQQYILQIIWQAEGYIFQRTFYGVTGRMVNQNSRGTNQFIEEQHFRAQFFQDVSGTTANPGGVGPIQPPAPLPGAAEPVGFFRENPLLTGEYLLGFYSWTVPVVLVSAQVIAWAPQSSPTVLTLEVGGVLTGLTVTIPVGDPNVEVSSPTVSLGNLILPANSLVRWRVTSAPGAVDAAWSCALVMQVAGME